MHLGILSVFFIATGFCGTKANPIDENETIEEGMAYK